VSLEKGAGSLNGWLAVDHTRPDTDVSSTALHWFKPMIAGAQHYPFGWPEGVTLPLIDDTFGAFVRGRAIITNAGGALSDAQLSALKAERDRALAAWELALVGNIIRYANDTLQALAKAGTPDYAFETHAKYWSELKAFALFLQFNPRAKISPAQLDQLHARIGQAPVLPSAGEANLTKARADLVAAKDLLADVYALDARLVGNADGTNGW
jgi:hypothetical protein